MIDPFSEESGLAAPFRLAVEGPGFAGAEVREFRGPFALLGRDAAADLVLDHPGVDPRHAYIQVVGGRAFAVALSERAEILWPDGPRPLGWMGGEAIRVGPYLVRRPAEGRAGVDGLPHPTARAFKLDGAAELALEYPGEGARRRVWRASRVLVLVGWSTSCRIRLPEPGVAPIHAAIVRTTEGAWVVDLFGPGGVSIGGKPVRYSRLAHGDQIRIGPHRIGVRLASPAASVSSELLPATRQDRSLAARPEVPDPLLNSVLDQFARMQEDMADRYQQTLMTMFRLFSDMHQGQMHLIREELARLHASTEATRSLLPPASAAIPDPTPDPDPAPVEATAPPPVDDPPTPAPAEANGDVPPFPRPAVIPDEGDVHLMIMRRLAAIGDEDQGRWRKFIGSMLGR